MADRWDTAPTPQPVPRGPEAVWPSRCTLAFFIFIFLVINNVFNYLASYSTHITEIDKATLWFTHPVVSDSPVTPWTVARQALLSMRFPRREQRSGLPCLLDFEMSNCQKTILLKMLFCFSFPTCFFLPPSMLERRTVCHIFSKFSPY